MTENLYVPELADKARIYEALLPQIQSLIAGEKNRIANLANIAAVLKQAFHWWWVGFYLVENNELVLGPFQGPLACTRIALGKGVCGTSWVKQQTIIVEDVDQFPGHIACSALSRSEIVVPIFNPSGEVIGVLDCDSEQLSHYDQTDALYLEKICALIG